MLLRSFLETRKVRGAIIVSAYHSDLGDRQERESGYFSRPWLWDAIAANAGFLVQYHSVDDVRARGLLWLLFFIAVEVYLFMHFVLLGVSPCPAPSSLLQPLVPVDEARLVAAQTRAEYVECVNRGHFMERTFPELLAVLLGKLGVEARAL